MKARSGVTIDLSALHLNGQTVNLALRDGRIAAITPVAGPARAVILPLPVDPHVHLDKTFTISRCRATKSGLFGAIEAMQADFPRWTVADLRERAARALIEAASNGIAALRSHIDWNAPGVPLAWEVLGDLAQEWQGQIRLQRSALVPLDLLGDPDHGPAIAARVARDGAVLGSFVYRNAEVEAKLARVFALADRHGLLLDFHTDEGLEPEADSFDAIVALAARHGMAGRVLCGHACSLAIRPKADADRAMAAAAAAGVAVTVLPATNLYLQDMAQGRSPRLRGLAPLQELRAAGVEVCLAADNVADPFYPMGCYDQIEVLRLASLAGQVDPAGWTGAITSAPARAMGLPIPGIAVGASADFMLIDGVDWEDALRSARNPRRIIRAGQDISTRKVAA